MFATGACGRSRSFCEEFLTPPPPTSSPTSSPFGAAPSESLITFDTDGMDDEVAGDDEDGREDWQLFMFVSGRLRVEICFMLLSLRLDVEAKPAKEGWKGRREGEGKASLTASRRVVDRSSMRLPSKQVLSEACTLGRLSVPVSVVVVVLGCAPVTV